MRLGFKIAGAILLFTFTTSLVLYLVGNQKQQSVIREVSLDQIAQVRGTFESLKKEDLLILSAALESIVHDAVLKEVYLRRDRNELYAYAQPLFRNLEERYRITHFYFIDPDGRVFLRMHNRGIHGDPVLRRSFLAAKAARGPATEMELGKTAFALRAVMPWYRDGALIGYVELGEEIGHFLRMLKPETDSEFWLLAKKTWLDRADWLSVKREAGLPDTWGDLRDHVVIATTSVSALVARCFTEEHLKRVEQGEFIFGERRETDRVFTCGGFTLTNTAGENVGEVLCLIDVSKHAALAAREKRSILLAACLLFAVAFPSGLLLSRPFTRPVANLTRVARAVSRGDLDRRAAVTGNDEIGVLAGAFNDMIERRTIAEAALQKSHDDLERVVAERSEELQDANERLHHLSTHLQEVREDERTRVAREIHDELGQSLAAIRIELSLLWRGLEGRQIIERVDSLNALVESTTRAVRRISQDLRPGVLDNLGLSAAVEWQGEEFERLTGIPCAVSVEPGEIVLDEARSTAIFRILQEALTNVARHAQAQGVNVVLHRGDTELMLQVQDDGRGMIASGVASNSFGIIGMQERVRAWGGTVDIASSRGAGTTVTVRLPLVGRGGAS